MSATWEPGLGDHLRTIWRRKWLVIGGATFVAEAVFLLLTFVASPRYEAEASMRLTIEADGGLVLDDERVEYASRIYTELAESPAVLVQAVERSGLDLDREAAARAITVQWARPAGFIDITASVGTAKEAELLADGMAEAIGATIATDSERLAEADGGTVLATDIVESADAGTSPAWPHPIRDAIAAFVISLVVLAELVALWRPARGLLPLSRTAELVTELVGIPSLTLTGDPEDRTRLGAFSARHLGSTPAAVVVQCTGDARPAVPVRLGEALTASGRRSLVVDGDSLDPSLHWWLSLPRDPGLHEVATDRLPLAEAVFESEAKAEVSLLTAGGGGDGEAPTGEQTIEHEQIIEQLTPGYDCVLVCVGPDSPLDAVATAVTQMRSSTVLVIDPERTTRRRLADLVHGYGGHEDVIAILLMSKAAAAAETKRLSTRSWKRKGYTGTQPTSSPRRLSPFRAGRQAS